MCVCTAMPASHVILKNSLYSLFVYLRTVCLTEKCKFWENCHSLSAGDMSFAIRQMKRYVAIFWSHDKTLREARIRFSSVQDSL